jgi:peptidoglycan hydrolase-like protein with peptidoglycan-binding domain
MPNVTGPTSPSTNVPASGTGPTSFANARFASDPTLEKVVKGSATLTKGAKGESVTRLQRALLDMGYALRPYTSASSGKPVGGVDGSFGNQTANALANFQRHAMHQFPDVKATGILDVATMKALDKLSPPPGGKPWDSASEKLPTPFYDGKALRVVVCKDEHRTYLFDKQGKVAGVFSNSVGAQASQTDTGLKKVTGKLGRADAEAVGKKLWNSPKAFGDRIVDLSWDDGRRSGEELHGTYAYDQMGQDVSHGCVRHYNEDVLTLFDTLAMGDRVAIVQSMSDPHLKR